MFAEKPSPADGGTGKLSIKQVTPDQNVVPKKIVDTTVGSD